VARAMNAYSGILGLGTDSKRFGKHGVSVEVNTHLVIGAEGQPWLVRGGSTGKDCWQLKLWGCFAALPPQKVIFHASLKVWLRLLSSVASSSF
jgi:hypothetical protein